MPLDLNSQEPETEYGRSRKQNKDNSTAGDGVSAYFRYLVPRLIEHIQAANAVFGCVTWLPHPEIMDALRGRHTAIVVQKEDFLSPDLGDNAFWKRDLRRRNDAQNCWFSRFDFGNMIGSLSTGGHARINAVRRVGNFNRERMSTAEAHRRDAWPLATHAVVSVALVRHRPEKDGSPGTTHAPRWDRRE